MTSSSDRSFEQGGGAGAGEDHFAVVAEQFGQEPDKVAAIVMLGNLAAVVFVPLGLWLGLAGSLPAWAVWIMPAAALAILFNIFNRVRSGVDLARRTP